MSGAAAGHVPVTKETLEQTAKSRFAVIEERLIIIEKEQQENASEAADLRDERDRLDGCFALTPRPAALRDVPSLARALR